MAEHSTTQRINDPSSKEFHTHSNASVLLSPTIYSYLDFHSLLFLGFLLELLWLACFPFLRVCSGDEFNLTFNWPQADLFPPPLWLLLSGLSQVPAVPSSSKRPSGKSFYNWACCWSVAVLASIQPPPFALSSPTGTVVFSLGQAQPVASPLQGSIFLPPSSSCAFAFIQFPTSPFLLSPSGTCHPWLLITYRFGFCKINDIPSNQSVASTVSLLLCHCVNLDSVQVTSWSLSCSSVWPIRVTQTLSSNSSMVNTWHPYFQV